MGLAYRIIPILLTRHGNLVKGVKFDSNRVVGNMMQAAMLHQARGVDELIVLDVAASPEGRGPDIEAMRCLTDGCFMPVAVGGGVSTLNHIKQLIQNGADKVVINSAAEPRLIYEAVDKFGSQAIVVAIDAENDEDHIEIRAIQAIEAGAGELMIGNKARDGTLSGYDVTQIRNVSYLSPVPVIAAHGCGTYEHMAEALRAGASAVAAGAMFQFLDLTPKGAAEYLSNQGFEVRL